MNSFFRSPTTDENQSGKRKTTMKNEIQRTNIFAPIRNKLGCSLWRRLVLIIPLIVGFASLVISPAVRALDFDCHQICTGSDGALPAYSSAVGHDALYTAFDDIDYDCYLYASHNTAMGAFSLQNDCAGSYNTAMGANTFILNINGSY